MYIYIHTLYNIHYIIYNLYIYIHIYIIYSQTYSQSFLDVLAGIFWLPIQAFGIDSNNVFGFWDWAREPGSAPPGSKKRPP